MNFWVIVNKLNCRYVGKSGRYRGPYVLGSLAALWRWCYTGQFATPTCNADSQRMFFRTNLQTCYTCCKFLNRFQNLATCNTALQISQKIVRNGVLYWNRFFAQHHWRIIRRIIATWRCKLTSVTPPLGWGTATWPVTWSAVCGR